MDRLMELRDALVALKGPLANDLALREGLQKRLFNEETYCRVLGDASTAVTHTARSIRYDEEL
nr:type VI secretion system contractile sheath small subunit [Pseudomonas palleroniana]